MPDWTKSMTQTFEYYTVDPNTWRDREKLTTVKSSTLLRDKSVETLGSATIDITDSVGEEYIRTYLITIQNGITEKHPLGTYLVQTPSSSHDGRIRSTSMDAYTPLIELKENPPPLGYSILKDANILENAYLITVDNLRAPVVRTISSDKLYNDFVANSDDTWLTYTSDLLANAKHEFDLDEMGRVLFAPKQEIEKLVPVWTYTDDNSSILHPEINLEHDLYDVPNYVEVIYSNGREHFYGVAINDDSNSPTSTVNRGRVIKRRITNPDLGNPTEDMIQEYAERALKELSTVEYTLSYTHAYCPVRLGDCVRLNYSRAGLTDIKAKVVYQSIKCEPGCPVSEKAVFTVKLWG